MLISKPRREKRSGVHGQVEMQHIFGEKILFQTYDFKETFYSFFRGGGGGHPLSCLQLLAFLIP